MIAIFTKRASNHIWHVIRRFRRLIIKYTRNRLTRLINKLILWLDNRVSKSKAVWAFPVCYLNYHLFDNARPVFEALKNNPDIIKIVLYRGKIRPVLTGKQVKLIKLYSLFGFYWLFRSKVVFVRHCVIQDIGFPINNSKRLVVNLWHGSPLKKIGVQGIPNSITGCDPLGAIISSSLKDSQILISSFVYANSENTWITGLPRNDLLFTPECNLWQGARDELDQIRHRLAGRKLILFAPTYRAAWEGWDDKIGFYEFSDEQLATLLSIAKQSGAVIGIRTHLREAPSVLKVFEGLDVIVLNDIIETGLVLKMTDILISDYSSLMIDFLLTRRPVLSFAFDYETYTKGRGFLYDLECVLPNPLCFTFNELVSALTSALNDLQQGKEISGRYCQAIKLFHSYPDDQATNRVIAKTAKAVNFPKININ